MDLIDCLKKKKKKKLVYNKPINIFGRYFAIILYFIKVLKKDAHSKFA